LMDIYQNEVGLALLAIDECHCLSTWY